MAQIASYFYRDISYRADLFEAVLAMSFGVAREIVRSKRVGIEPLNILMKVQSVAKEILETAKFDRKEDLIKEVLEKTEGYWSSREVSQLSRKISLQESDGRHCKRILKQIGMAVLPLFGFKIIPLTQDLIAPSILPIEDISCFEFALARAGIAEIFTVPWSNDNLLHYLDVWGFTTISKEQSKPGDLVVFLEKGTPKHMSIQCEEGILSKPGNQRRFAYIHTLEEAPRTYGNQILFFRRNDDASSFL